MKDYIEQSFHQKWNYLANCMMRAPWKEAIDDEEETGKAIEADVRESPTHPCLEE